MVPPVDQRKVVGSTVHAEAIHVMAEAEYNRRYGSQKKVKMVEGFFYVDQQITKQRRKQFYIISDYKTPDGSVNRARLHTKYVVAGPVLVPVPVNIPVTAPLLTETKTTIFPANPSTSVPTDHHTPVDPAPVPTTTTTDFYPALLPTTTNVPANCPTIVAPHRNQQLPLPSLPILLLLLYLNLIQPPPHASMPIHLLKMPLYLIQLHLLKISLYLIRLHLFNMPLYLIWLHLIPVLLWWLLIVME